MFAVTSNMKTNIIYLHDISELKLDIELRGYFSIVI